MMVSRVALACIVSIALQAPAAEPSDRERAQQLNDEGSAAMDTHHYGEALDLFQRAARIYPSPKLSFNVGLALLKLGRKVEALAALESYLADVQDAPAEKRLRCCARYGSRRESMYFASKQMATNHTRRRSPSLPARQCARPLRCRHRLLL
jgi:tetratricopeptide (TPR) repeat protein